MPHDFGTPPSQVWLYVDRFVIDESYQRAISTPRAQKFIAQVAADFRWSAFQAVLASPAEGTHWKLIDGRRRVEGAKRIRNSDGSLTIPMVPATVIDASSPEAQADAFVRINSDRQPVDAFALHRANLVRGDAVASEIKRLADAAGLTIPETRPSRSTVKPGEVICLGTLAKLVKQYSPSLAQEAVMVVAEAYRDEPFGVRAPFPLAAAEMLSSGETDAATLLRAFKQSTSDALCREVGGHNTAKRTINVLAVLRQRLADQAPEVQGEELDESLRNFAADLASRQQPLGREFEQVLVDNLDQLYERQTRAEQQALTLPPLPSSLDPNINARRKAELEQIAAWTAKHAVTKCPSGPEMENVPFMEYDKKTNKWKRPAS